MGQAVAQALENVLDIVLRRQIRHLRQPATLGKDRRFIQANKDHVKLPAPGRHVGRDPLAHDVLLQAPANSI